MTCQVCNYRVVLLHLQRCTFCCGCAQCVAVVVDHRQRHDCEGT